MWIVFIVGSLPYPERIFFVFSNFPLPKSQPFQTAHCWDCKMEYLGLKEIKNSNNNNNSLKSRLSLFVRVNVVLNRTVVVDSD